MEDDSPKGRFRTLFAVFTLRNVPFWTTSAFRRWLRRGTFVLYLYIAHACLLLAVEDRLAFPGWTFDRGWHQSQAELKVQEIALRTADGNTIRALWMAPEGWKPSDGAVFFAHGNGRNVSHSIGLMHRWRDSLHTAVLGCDYPGFGPSTGKPNEASCYAATEAAFEWLTAEQKVPSTEVILVGQSMGGAMATEMASRHDCRMLVLVGSYTSFPDMAQTRFFWLPARYLVRSRFDNEGKIRTIHTPVFVAHGTADGVVPYWQGERLYAAAAGPKRLFTMQNHPHMHPRQPAFYDAVKEFLEQTRTE